MLWQITNWIDGVLRHLFGTIPLIPFCLSCFLVLSIFLLKEISTNYNDNNSSDAAVSPTKIWYQYLRQMYMIVLFVSFPILLFLLFDHFVNNVVGAVVGRVGVGEAIAQKQPQQKKIISASTTAQLFHKFIFGSSLMLVLFAFFIVRTQSTVRSLASDRYSTVSGHGFSSMVDPFAGLAYPLIQLVIHGSILWSMMYPTTVVVTSYIPAAHFPSVVKLSIVLSLVLLLIKIRNCAKVMQEEVLMERAITMANEVDDCEQVQDFVHGWSERYLTEEHAE